VFQEGGFVDFGASAVARPDEPQEVDHGWARVAPRDAERRGKLELKGTFYFYELGCVSNFTQAVWFELTFKSC